MSKYKKMIIGTIAIIILVIIGNKIIRLTNHDETQDNNITEKNSVKYQDNSSVEKLKEEYKYTGSNDIYEINTELDGRKVINVKADINYRVAFCGLIKNDKPSFQEIDSIFEENYPTESGIWIRQNDREKTLKYLNNNEYMNSVYVINSNGYLEVKQEKNPTEYDKNIETLINGDNQYIIAISSVCYMIEPVSGEIVDNPYNEFEEYQTYEYFTDENKALIAISENKENKMTKEEIFISIIDLFDLLK